MVSCPLREQVSSNAIDTKNFPAQDEGSGRCFCVPAFNEGIKTLVNKAITPVQIIL